MIVFETREYPQICLRNVFFSSLLSFCGGVLIVGILSSLRGVCFIDNFFSLKNIFFHENVILGYY